MKEICENIYYVGVNDHQVQLFEGQYPVSHGMSYNSYVIVDQKIAVMDSVDGHFGKEWLANIQEVLKDRQPDYLIVQHMEPDHSGCIKEFMDNYPNTTVVSSNQAFTMMKNYFGTDFAPNKTVVKEGDQLELGEHTLKFIGAPMVHWPEVIVTYETKEKILFSADGFGKFGALDQEEPWDDEARRYYIGIVGKFGNQVQNLLKKASQLDIQMICPLHGPVLKEDLGHYLSLYDTWSGYKVEKDGVLIVYSSVYGHTKKAAEILKEQLEQLNTKVEILDLSLVDISEAVSLAFAYGKIVLASITYNTDCFAHMKTFLTYLVDRNFQNKTISLIENGTWMPMAAKAMKKQLESAKNIEYVDPIISIKGEINEEQLLQINELAKILAK